MKKHLIFLKSMLLIISACSAILFGVVLLIKFTFWLEQQYDTDHCMILFGCSGLAYVILYHILKDDLVKIQKDTKDNDKLQ